MGFAYIYGCHDRTTVHAGSEFVGNQDSREMAERIQGLEAIYALLKWNKLINDFGKRRETLEGMLIKIHNIYLHFEN